MHDGLKSGSKHVLYLSFEPATAAHLHLFQSDWLVEEFLGSVVSSGTCLCVVKTNKLVASPQHQVSCCCL